MSPSHDAVRDVPYGSEYSPQASETTGGVGTVMSATQSTVSEVLAGIVKSGVRR